MCVIHAYKHVTKSEQKAAIEGHNVNDAIYTTNNNAVYKINIIK